MLPGNPFYFLKSVSEGVGTFFSFGDVSKAERFVYLADKRLAEVRALAERGDEGRAEKATEKYQERIAKALERAGEAMEKGKDVDEIMSKVAEATVKHQEVLARVYEQVSEQAKEAIGRAMELSARGHDEALKAVSGEKRDEIEDMIEGLKQEAKDRLEELRRKGVPIPELKNRDEREMEGREEDEDVHGDDEENYDDEDNREEE